MPKPFSLFDIDALAGGAFEYPPKLERFAATGDYPDIGPWWFIDADSAAGRLAWSVRSHDGRNLVPFAKVDDSRGDVACFDADSEHGAVYMLVLDDSGRKYTYASFDEWLRAAQADAVGSTVVQFGPRLMRRKAPFLDVATEQAELEAILAGAPGVVRVRNVKPHPRGGFVSVMEFAMPQLDAWVAYLDDRGWMNVM